MTTEATTIPEFDRTFTKIQPAGPRVFKASGPKAEAIIEMILTENFTVSEIVATTGASASRVGEVLWVMNANLDGFTQVAWKVAVAANKKAAAAAAKVEATA